MSVSARIVPPGPSGRKPMLPGDSPRVRPQGRDPPRPDSGNLLSMAVRTLPTPGTIRVRIAAHLAAHAIRGWNECTVTPAPTRET